MRESTIGAYVKNKATAVFNSSSGENQKRTASLEQIARETINQTYYEDDPSVAEWFQGLVPSSAGIAEYVSELFPSAQWVRRYNLHWLGGDIIAGTLRGSNIFFRDMTDRLQVSQWGLSLCLRPWRTRF
jgi:sodium-independent sulfate anion transporter 11